jgi:predicted kinase
MTSSITPDGTGVFVVVSGGPGSGKSTLAKALGPNLGLPVLAKDAFKEALMSAFDVPDLDASRAIGRASLTAMLAVAADCGSAVLDSVWHRAEALESLQLLPGRVVEVFCRCEPDTMAERHQARVGTRTSGHFDELREPGELWNAETTEPVAGGWPVIEVSTDAPVDADKLADQVSAALDVPVAAQATARPGWVVWREDEQGTRSEVTRRETREVATAVAEAMGSTGSKHRFWVTEAS